MKIKIIMLVIMAMEVLINEEESSSYSNVCNAYIASRM